MMNSIWIFRDAFGLFRYGKYMSLATAFLNLALSVWLGKLYGLAGILGATALSRLATNFWYDPYALFKHGFQQTVFAYYKEFLAYTAFGFAVFFVTEKICLLVHGADLLSVCLKFIIACILPNAVFLLAFFRTKSFSFVAERVGELLGGKFKKKVAERV